MLKRFQSCDRRLAAKVALVCCLLVCFSFAAKLTQYSAHPLLSSGIVTGKMHVTGDGSLLFAAVLPFACAVIAALLPWVFSTQVRFLPRTDISAHYLSWWFASPLPVRPPPSR